MYHVLSILDAKTYQSYCYYIVKVKTNEQFSSTEKYTRDKGFYEHFIKAADRDGASNDWNHH